MLSKIAILFFSFFVLVSCGKKEENIVSEIPKEENIITEIQYESIEGDYIGNQYKWSRGYDPTYLNVVETYDTVYNHLAVLEMDVDSDIIRFDGDLFEIHKPLSQIQSEDTVEAIWRESNRPFYKIIIVKSEKTIYSSRYSAATMGPLAGSINAVYRKK